MTNSARPVCECPERCTCYAEGYVASKDKTYFYVPMVLQEGRHAAGCKCEPCLVSHAVRDAALPTVSRKTLRPQVRDILVPPRGPASFPYP